jgi:hypothetical protein
VLVVGDTGCRVLADHGHVRIQDCSDPVHGWPFAEVAKAAAAFKPDLIIHVGDYLYREAPCPPGDARCAGSASGDSWAAWEQDLLTPAEPLLRAAPWIFVRGNHESCPRAGAGYQRLLSPYPYGASCVGTEAPYELRFGGTSLAVLDSNERDVDAGMLATLEALKLRGAWLFTHRPPWYVPTPDRKAPQGVGVPKGVSLVVSGHFHDFFAANFADQRPAEIISGNAGTKLDEYLRDLLGAPVDGTTISLFRSWNGFGFLTLEREGKKWKAVARGQSGESRLQCDLERTTRGTVQLNDCSSPK